MQFKKINIHFTQWSDSQWMEIGRSQTIEKTFMSNNYNFFCYWGIKSIATVTIQNKINNPWFVSRPIEILIVVNCLKPSKPLINQLPVLILSWLAHWVIGMAKHETQLDTVIWPQTSIETWEMAYHGNKI